MTIVKCMYYPDLSTTPRERIEARVRTLQDWPQNFLRAVSFDPRCGCGAPEDVCEWDSVTVLEGLL